LSVKLQKILAQAGYASRRKIEQWIQAGRITVNGSIAQLGCRIAPKDKVQIDGNPISLNFDELPATRLIVYHKPVGEIVTRSDPEGRPTVFSVLPQLSQGRWLNVGRLDINTSGLMLFTNEGGLAHQLMHPSSGFEREYVVRVFGKIKPEMLDRLVTGVTLKDGVARFEEIVGIKRDRMNQWFHVVVMAGRNRLVRRLWESQGVTVSRLKRTRFGPIFLEPQLKPGQWSELDEKVIRSLLRRPDIPNFNGIGVKKRR